MDNKVKIGLMIGGGVVLATIAAVLLFSKKSAGKLIEEAKKYVGQQEIYNDQGFYDKAFEKKMATAGWAKGLQWCALFVRMVFLQCAKGKALEFFRSKLNASANGSFQNIKAAGKNDYAELIPKPEAGCLVCYVHHIEFCESVNGDKMTVISGNSSLGSGKHGVSRTQRTISKPFEELNGYIRIKKID